ncbi:MAG: YncE family protein [Candidatus Aminicenantia bacterium]
MHKFFNLLIIVLISNLIYADYSVKKVDFLTTYNLKYNGAGPILVEADSIRNRVILANTYTSSISIIDGKDNFVVNVPVKNRIPQYLKSEALAIDKRTGNIYVIGNKSLHIVFPENKTAKTIDTIKQFEMVAIDENSSNAFLVGRESNRLAFVRLKHGKVKYIKWAEKEETLINLNQTPPPSIRKVVSDNNLKKVFAIDGYTSTLFIFSSKTGRLLRKRKLNLISGARWHFAGYNEKTHYLYLVVETDKRKVIQAAKIDVLNINDVIVKLPEFTEGVGINYNPKLDEIYIPYDNHPSVHVVDFKDNGKIFEIKIPAYGNDASAIDIQNDILYIASWAYGEIYVIDLKNRKSIKRIRNLGIIPHMFNLALNTSNNKLYIPLGATAVNGSFGAALTVLDPVNGHTRKIYTGWAPVDLIQLKGKESFLVFNSEDEFAEVNPDGSYKTYKLPYSYPHQAIYTKDGNIYLSYGPHQSYWPVVYIWGAKNGIMKIDAKTLTITDRRIPRLAQRIVTDKNGILYALQNNWGREKQFLTVMEDDIREFMPEKRIELAEEVERETIQRILKYDEEKNSLYIVKIGEKDQDKGVLQVIDLKERKIAKRIYTGITPTDLVFNKNHIYISNFDTNTITVVDKNDFSVKEIKTGNKPLKLSLQGKTLYVINHQDNTLQEIGDNIQTYKIPYRGNPDNIFTYNNKVILTSHSDKELHIICFDTIKKEFKLIHNEIYPYGETTFDTSNTAFYVRGQFGDAIFDITKIKSDDKERLWITDYLAGKLFIISKFI